MKFVILVLVAIAAFASALRPHPSAVTPEFLAYCKEYGKEYSNEELAERASIYAANVAEIEAHNANPSSLYQKGINQFTDMTEEDRKAFKGKYSDADFGAEMATFGESMAVPSSWDWRQHGAVNPIQNQASCGVCWAFAAASATESSWFIKTKRLVLLAPSQLVDCDTTGGSNEGAFMYYKRTGACSMQEYPYECPDNQPKCKTCNPVTYQLNSYRVIQSSNETALKIAVYQQPVAIGIAASGDFMGYKSGIFNGNCPGGRDHAVVLVGYGTENGVDFWILRNQWSTAWGEQGYMRIIRDVKGQPDGHCILATDPSIPIF